MRRIAGVVIAGLLVLVPTGAWAAPSPTPSADSSGSSSSNNAKCVQRGDPYPQVPWAQTRLDPEAAWPQSRGHGVRVAVVDSGVSAVHPQLRGRVEGGASVIPGGGSPTEDCVGHGTIVAGIIAGQGENGTGFHGVAPEAVIVPIKTLENLQVQEGLEPRIAAGIRAAISQHVQVINLSLTTTNDDPQVRAAVQDAIDSDIVVVAAAGNQNQQGNQKQYPAAYPGVLAVAAIKRDGTRADFSETGDYVAVSAPGAEIVGPSGAGSGYVGDQQGGTSYAAPYVSGVAALVRAYYPRMRAKEVVQRILETADRPGTGPNEQVGYGVVNPYRAVNAILTTGGQAPPRAGALPAPSESDKDALTRTVALIVAGVLLFAGILVLVGAYVVPRGRARGWRPGRLIVSTGKPGPKP
ncbi:type VII secretion-associated serine protease mycosin [Fodinicola acaciae]|uniref:type VII secretion-associated serine protease mycosin n=1 Tax=Fodinicola acaciae TaxID=2681555 RepID=UPI0013D8AAA5|nr:type VII secretion-associated serine protease mycosin [Fodinicola acaciae]